jgi:hypothetical protein
LTVPHVGQPAASGVAHSEQNFAPERFSVPQFVQVKSGPSRNGMSRAYRRDQRSGPGRLACAGLTCLD